MNFKICCTIIYLMCTLPCISQSLDKQVIASTGSSSSEFTIGEVIISSGNLTVSSGFQHPSFMKTEPPLSIRDISNELKVYPIPSSNIVSISVDLLSLQDASIKLYNLEGRQVTFTQQIMENKIHINITDLPAGIYFLTLNNPINRTMARYKIQKIN